MMKPRYTVVQWPDSQELMEYPGFEDYCFLINDERGMEQFGDSAYFVDCEWLQRVQNDQNP